MACIGFTRTSFIFFQLVWIALVDRNHHTYLHSWTRLNRTKRGCIAHLPVQVYYVKGMDGADGGDSGDGCAKGSWNCMAHYLYYRPWCFCSCHLDSEICDTKTILRSSLGSRQLAWPSSSSMPFDQYHFGLSVSSLHPSISRQYRSNRTEVALCNSAWGGISPK